MAQVFTVHKESEIPQRLKDLDLDGDGVKTKYLPNDWRIFEVVIDEETIYFTHHTCSGSKIVEKFGSMPK